MERNVNTLRKSYGKLETHNIAYLLILPNYLIYFVFTLIPIVWTLGLSFTDYNLSKAAFVGAANYVRMFTDSLFLKSFWNTLVYSFITIVPTMAVGLSLAIMLNMKIRGRNLFRAVFYMPNIFSMVVVAMSWLYLYDTHAGILNRILRMLGASPVPWLTSPEMAMFSVCLMSIWNGLGYNMVVFLAGLQTIPEYLYEAASIDGASWTQQFRKITLPMLAPTTFFIFVMSCIRSFQVFGQVLILTNGGPMESTTTVAHQIYKNGFEFYEMGYASAQSVVLLLVILGITMINMKYGKGEQNDVG